MSQLFEKIQARVQDWRNAGYPAEKYPAIAEILEFATIPDDEAGPQLRFLRAAQLRALETYWYLRLVEDTPLVKDLYLSCYEEPLDRFAALGMMDQRITNWAANQAMKGQPNAIWDRLTTDVDKTDPFFDGTRGKQLVRIIPFTHPLTLEELQLVRDELASRPDEQRDVLLVCLGKETRVDPWLEEYNRRRPLNRIHVIELRTDERYGKFFVHQPARAEVRITREDGKILVAIDDFLSPTIVERLELDLPLFRAHIPDWRAMVDTVQIDPAYDGTLFRVALADIPEKKDDLVSGRYELPAPDSPTTVAVKIVDMLGEELLITGTA